MKPIVVESTTLASVAYQADSEILELQFRNQAIYRYFRVPAPVYEALLSAPSKGRYFNRLIRGRFPYAQTAPTGDSLF